MKHIRISDIQNQDELAPLLDWLLYAFPALQSLEIRSVDGTGLPDLDDYGDLFRLHGQGLQRLVLDAGCGRQGEEQLEEAVISGLGDLRSLTNLKELDVTPWTLLDLGAPSPDGGDRHLVEFLPSSLQTLTLLPWSLPGLMFDID